MSIFLLPVELLSSLGTEISLAQTNFGKKAKATSHIFFECNFRLWRLNKKELVFQMATQVCICLV